MSSIDELPVGTVTFLFSDVEGSTQLLKQLGGERYGVALADHQRILREAFTESGGHEIDTQGDSFFVAFRRAKDAVSAAIMSQRGLVMYAWPDDTELRVRMGIHTGEPAIGGERYVGLGVHRAARICAAGHGGQVLLSQTTRELLRDDPIPDVSLSDLGAHQLKDLDEPEHLYQLVVPGLQQDFPALKTATPAPFEGREGELAEAAAVQMAKSWRRPSRRVLIGATFAAAVVGVSVGVLLTQSGGSSAGAAVGANSVGVVDAGNGKVVSQIPVGTSPNAIAVGPDAVWVTNTNDNTVSRIDASTNTVQQTIQVGAGPVGVAVGGGPVWVANGLDGTVSRIDPTINREVETIPVGNGPSGVAYGEGFVWVTNSVDGTVSRIDPSGREQRTFPAVAGASGIAVGFGDVWVVSPASGTLVEIDPRSGQVLQTIAVGVDPSAVATGAGAVWVANRADGTISKIDPRSASVQGLIRVGSRPTGIAADSRALWVASQGEGTLSRFDPSTEKRIATSDLGNPPAGIASAPQGVFVAVKSTELEHRGGNVRVLLPDEVISIDPLNANASSQILYLTNDGLVGFRKVGGVEGTQLVPDLAVTLPKPTDSGKTYTFQVRSGIRYSNGRFVRPQDFKHELERLFEVVGGGRLGATGDYSKIVGANRCTAGKPCNLDSGIIVDRTAHTVTFHLTAPDPDFLAKLAQPVAFAASAGTPAREVGAHPIPATGPYRIAFFGRKEKSVRLVRNRFFHEWSTDAQPQGYPDSISFSWRLSADRSAQIRAVERGAGDVALSGPFSTPPSKDAIERLSVRYPSQLHLNTEVMTGFFFLNTRVAPFTDVRVRRAVNIAFDRQVFAHVNGRASAPTCRYLPPGTPGYRPICPYGAGGVTGLDAARRLVKSSGTAGARVTVWTPWDVSGQSRFMVSVLDSLGYRATLKVVGPHGGPNGFGVYFARVSDSRVGAQIGYIGWQGAWPSASAFLPIIVSCATYVPAAPNKNTNLSGFCDHSIDAQMARASAVQAQDPPTATPLWQQVERSLASQAPYVPYYNARAVDFVSKRVGNYQYNPTSGALLSQLWVK